jgi:hypothetical protein
MKIFHVTISFFERVVDGRIDEGIIFSIPRPRADFRDPGILDEAPVNGGLVTYTEVVSNSGGDIDPRTLVVFVLRAFVSEDILPIIGHERSAILPLGVADFAGFRAINLNPTPFAGGFSRFAIDPIPPRDHACCFRFVHVMVQAVVIREGDVKRVLPRI